VRFGFRGRRCLPGPVAPAPPRECKSGRGEQLKIPTRRVSPWVMKTMPSTISPTLAPFNMIASD
jgi:hypothetical protein